MAFRVSIGACFTFFFLITGSATAWNPFLCFFSKKDCDDGGYMLASTSIGIIYVAEKESMETIYSSGPGKEEMERNALVQKFIEHYYTTFDTNRRGLENLYKENSTLSFEGQKIQGVSNIISKYTSLPFQTSQHYVSTADYQPSAAADGALLVFVTGNLQVDGAQHDVFKFSQFFHLMPTSQGSYYVLNEMFRLSYA